MNCPEENRSEENGFIRLTDSKANQPSPSAARTPHQSDQPTSDGRNENQTGGNEFDRAAAEGKREFEDFVQKVGKLRTRRRPLHADGHWSTGAILVSATSSFCDNFWLDDNNASGSRMASFMAIASGLGSFFFANMETSDQFRRAAYERELRATEQNMERLEDKYEQNKKDEIREYKRKMERLEDKYEGEMERLGDKIERQMERLEDKYEQNKKDETREYERNKKEETREYERKKERLEDMYERKMERPVDESGLQEMLQRLESSYTTKMNQLKDDFDNSIKKSGNEHDKTMFSLEAKHLKDQSELTSNHEKALKDLETSCERCEICKLNKKILLTNALYGTNNGMQELPSVV